MVGTVNPTTTDPTTPEGGGCTSTGPGTSQQGWDRAAVTARRLAWASLAWMTAEGALGLLAGYRAGSIALVSWAFGSVVEGLASVIVIWRLSGARRGSRTSERRAQRAVAISFWLLVPYIVAQSVDDLIGGHRPQATLLGIALAAASVVVMPGLGWVKHRLGARLASAATAGEGTQNYLCAAQGAAVLVALAVTAASGPVGRWVDPAIALVLAAWSVREGAEAWAGEDCC